MFVKEDLIIFIRRVPAEVFTMLDIIREKGVRYFRRPLVIACVFLAIVYYVVYKAPASRLSALGREKARVADIAQYVSRYQSLKDQLAAYSARLPGLKGKDHGSWLVQEVTESMRVSGVQFNSLSGSRIYPGKAVETVSINISCNVPYHQLVAWIAKLEASSPAIRVSRMGLSKDETQLGKNRVELTVSAVFPTEGGNT